MPAIRTILLLSLAYGPAAHAALNIGASLPLSGIRLEQGQMVKDGLAAALQETSSADPRRKISLEVLDDKGDPAIAARNAEQLITQHQVQAIVGCVGEAACAAVAAVARRHRVPLIGAILANDEVCRDKLPVFCLHAPYPDEAAAIARQLKTLGTRVVHLWVSDELSAYESRIVAAFEAGQLAVTAHRSGPAGDRAKNPPPFPNKADEAHVLFLNHDDAVTTTRRLRQGSAGALIAALSSIEPFRWLQKTQGLSSGVLIAHSLPNPDLARTRLAKAYQKAMGEFSVFNLPYEYAQLESYLLGRLLAGLAQQGVADKQGLAQAMTRNSYRIDDLDIAFANDRRTLAAPVGLSVVSRDGVLRE